MEKVFILFQVFLFIPCFAVMYDIRVFVHMKLLFLLFVVVYVKIVNPKTVLQYAIANGIRYVLYNFNEIPLFLFELQDVLYIIIILINISIGFNIGVIELLNKLDNPLSVSCICAYYIEERLSQSATIKKTLIRSSLKTESP